MAQGSLWHLQSLASQVVSRPRCSTGSLGIPGNGLSRAFVFLQEDLEEVPTLQEMQKYNTSELQLPQVPLSQGGTMMKAKPQRIPSWAAVPRRN